MNRREFLLAAAGSPLLLAAVPSQSSPYGELLAADENGFMLPPGFSSRLLATAVQPVGPSGYVWHVFPDGGATFPTDDGGWIYVSNSELLNNQGGVGALRFAADGSLVDAYSICTGTSTNCAGGATPWGTWLTCEEVDEGQVWECDPTGARPAVVRPAMGQFRHEAVAADPDTRTLYLTEDSDGGQFYRFTPSRWEDLSDGVLEAASTDESGAVTWVPVDDERATTYAGGEGIAFYAGKVAFTTKSDQRIREYDVRTAQMRVLHEPGQEPEIVGPDNIVFSTGGDLYVCEDTEHDQDLVLIGADGSKSQVLHCVGHDDSELAGAAFDPSGTRLYLSSQRGRGGGGATYEIAGPFRQLAAEAASTTTTPTTGVAARPDTTGGSRADDDFPVVPVAGAGVVAAVGIIGGLAWWRHRRL